MTTLEQRDAYRDQLMNLVYDIADSNTAVFVDYGHHPEIVSTGIAFEEIELAMDWLVDRRLLKRPVMGPVVHLTSTGIEVVERARRDQPAARGNVLLVDHVAMQAVEELLRRIRSADEADELGVEGEERAELERDLQAVQTQIGSSKPKRGIVVEGLRSLRRILEGSTAGVIATNLAPAVTEVLSKIH